MPKLTLLDIRNAKRLCRLGTDFFKALAVRAPALTQAEMDVQNLMMRIIWHHPEILVAEVFKRLATCARGRLRHLTRALVSICRGIVEVHGGLI